MAHNQYSKLTQQKQIHLIATEKKLNNEKDFNQVGNNVVEILKQLDSHHSQLKVNFINRVLENVCPLITSKDYDSISQKLKVMFNLKQKDEKPNKKTKLKQNATTDKDLFSTTQNGKEKEEEEQDNDVVDDDFM